jgi:hypothetical protein
MAISMYQASVPQLKKMLLNLSAILTKAEEHAVAKGIDDKVLVEVRLFPDMFPLAKQIQIACDQVKFGLARLASVEAPKFDDTERTLAQLKERISKTIAFMDSIKPSQLLWNHANDACSLWSS